jgi:hypothetical protein
VVFFGVWLGLLAETFRESRQEGAAERVSLGRLARDLAYDHRDMSGNRQRASEGLAAAIWILERADSSGVARDSLEYYLTVLQQGSILNANTSEYTALKGAGRINILRNAEFRQRLTQLYESYPFIQQLHDGDNSWFRDAMAPIASFIRVGPPDGSGPAPGYGRVRVVGDSGHVLGQPEFLLSVSWLATYRSFLVARYGEALQEIDELQALAEREDSPGASHD